MLEPLQKPKEDGSDLLAIDPTSEGNIGNGGGKAMAEDNRLNEFLKLTIEQKDMMTCDDIFALYLGYVSKQVNAIYYRTVTKFVLLFRECMNQKGWIKRREYQVKASITLGQDPVWAEAKLKQHQNGVPEMPWKSVEEKFTDQHKSEQYSQEEEKESFDDGGRHLDASEDEDMDDQPDDEEMHEYGEEEMEEYGEEGEAEMYEHEYGEEEVSERMFNTS